MGLVNRCASAGLICDGALLEKSLEKKCTDNDSMFYVMNARD